MEPKKPNDRDDQQEERQKPDKPMITEEGDPPAQLNEQLPTGPLLTE